MKVNIDIRPFAQRLNLTLKTVFGGDAGDEKARDHVHVGLLDDQIVEMLPNSEEFYSLLVSEHAMSIGDDLWIIPFLGEGRMDSLYTIHWRMSEGHFREYEDVEAQDFHTFFNLLGTG